MGRSMADLAKNWPVAVNAAAGLVLAGIIGWQFIGGGEGEAPAEPAVAEAPAEAGGQEAPPIFSAGIWSSGEKRCSS